jgi:hypothetical protein
MASAHFKLPCLILFGALLACATTSPVRLLDEVCEDEQCAISGSARQTSGPTSDSIGFELGPGPGSVNIMVPPAQSQFGNRLELLARGRGSVSVTIERASCAPSCGANAVELSEDWRWVPVGNAGPTLLMSNSAGFTLVIETSDETSTAALLDLRFR